MTAPGNGCSPSPAATPPRGRPPADRELAASTNHPERHDMYDVALFLHICGVVLLVGAVTTTMLATLRAQKAETVGELRSLTAATKTIDRVIGPAMLLILAPGLYMVSRHGDDGSIRWTSGWVDVAIALFLLMAVLGPAVETRLAKRLLQAAP